MEKSVCILLRLGGSLMNFTAGKGFDRDWPCTLINWTVPVLPVHISAGYVVLAECVAIFIGMMSGVIPSYRASALNPVDALRAE